MCVCHKTASILANYNNWQNNLIFSSIKGACSFCFCFLMNLFFLGIILSKLNKKWDTDFGGEKTMHFNEDSNKISGFGFLWMQFIHFHSCIYLFVMVQLGKVSMDILTGYFYFFRWQGLHIQCFSCIWKVYVNSSFAVYVIHFPKLLYRPRSW